MSARSMLALLCMGAAAAGAGDRPAQDPATRALAVDGLIHSAESLGHSDAGASAAGFNRIGVLLRCARGLDPDSAAANRRLVEYYRQAAAVKEDLVDADRVKEVTRRYLLAAGDDYAVGAQWVRWSQKGLNDAEQRIKALDGIIADTCLSKAIRSRAAIDLVAIYMGQSNKERARGALAKARELDPYSPDVVLTESQLKTSENLPTQILAWSLNLLRGDPRSPQPAGALAKVLQEQGMHPEALAYFRLSRELIEARPPGQAARHRFLLDYLSALLDAGRAEEAVKVFEPLISELGGGVRVRERMVEAWRAAGDKAKADAQVAALAEIYGPLVDAGAARTGAQAAELAWFHLTSDPKPAEALERAREAQEKSPHDPFVARVLGMAQIKAGQGAAGAKRLRPLAGKDAFAAAALAEYYIKGGQKAEAARVAAEAAKGCPRAGAGWRRLVAAARAGGIAVPPSEYADAMAKLLKQQPADVLEMGLHPERFIRASVKTPHAQVAPGDPIELTVELTNISTSPVPLGASGLFQPTLAVSVKVAGALARDYPNLVFVVPPAPRYLQPGATTGRTVRLDVGGLEDALMSRPMDALDLTVTAVLDPLRIGDKTVSSVPTIATPPVRIRRAALFDRAGGPQAAKVALGLIVRDLRRGGAAAQVKAARRTASLLAHVRNAEMGKATAVVPEVIDKPIVLSMTRAFLRHERPVVRAEMLAALHAVPLDERIIALTAPCVSDADPLVRLRVLDLLAGRRTRGYQGLVKLFAKDADPYVREMAAVFGVE